MSVRAIDFTSSAYAKTKSFKAKENLTSASKIKERRSSENQLSGVKSSWTPLKQDLNEKLFDERKELVSNWFDRWSDVQRRTILEILLSKCKNSQLQYTFSLIDDKIPITHVDFTRKLPRVITVYILSFLDPRSLCRCAQVCWFWKYLSELDQIWMPKCFKFGWILPFVPTPFEQGVWKRHYLECVMGLQYIRPKSPPGSPNSPVEKTISRSQSNGTLFKKTNKKSSVHEIPPWRGPDPHPNDIKRKLSNEGHIGGCRRCHMSTHTENNDKHEQTPKKGTATKSTKPRIRPTSAHFAPESDQAGTKFNTRTGRPDWAIQSSISPVRATRPPPSEIKPSAQTLGNSRGVRDPPEMATRTENSNWGKDLIDIPTTSPLGEELFKSQPWRRPAEWDDSD